MDIPNLELLFIAIFGIISLFMILAYTEKMSVGIALLSILTGVGIAWLFAPFMQLVITPIGDYIIYGYALNLTVISSIYFVIGMIAMVLVAIYNQIVSDGEMTWA